MQKEEVLELLNYSNREQRDLIKEYFTNPPELDHSKKTVVFSTPSETGTSFFRVFEPMKAILRNFPDELNLIYTECLQPNHLKLADCVVMHRCGNLHSHFLSAARFWPKTEVRPYIIHDADDNEFNLPKTHPMKELWEASGKHKMSIHSIKSSDFVTTTTNKLSQTFKNFNNNVGVVRNRFDWNLPQWNHDKYAVRKEMLPEWDLEGKIVIGWAGLTSHFSDIKRMAPILKEIHDKYSNTYFVLAGMALKDSQVEIVEDEKGKKQYKEVEMSDDSQKYSSKVAALLNGMDPKRFKLFNALPLEEYAKFNCLFDIALAYIEQNAFNSCKSEIKVVEALKYGAIPVFSNYGGYKDMWDMVPNNIKTKQMAVDITSSKSWVKAISHWVENFDEGVAAASKISNWSNEKYDINEHIETYLSDIMNRTENHIENQVNQVNKYIDYNPELI